MRRASPPRYTVPRPPHAGMAELADAKVSKTFERKLMGVRSPLPAPFRSSTSSTDSVQSEVLPARNCEPVLLAVGAPRGATPGSSFIARFAAYVPPAKGSGQQHLEALGGKDDRVVTDIPPDRDAGWRVGAPITVRLTGEHMTITPEERTFEWNGHENLASFAVRVDADAPPVTLLLCFHVFLGPLRSPSFPSE